jgi:N-acetylmuramoyl-L-alanine amidase
VDSTFIFGSVGNGRATLTINGAPVQRLAPNGAFLAYLPVPANGVWELTAQLGEQVARSTVAYRAPAPLAATRPAPAPALVPFPTPLSGTVTAGTDTLATGAVNDPGTRTAFARRGLAGDFRWFFPRGAQLTAIGRRAGQLQLLLDANTTAYIPDSLVTLGGPAPAVTRIGGVMLVRPALGYVDVIVPANRAAFLTEPEGSIVRLTLYGRSAPSTAPNLDGDPLLLGGTWSAPAPDAARLEIQLAQPLWGYKVFYQPDGSLVLRIRRAPRIDASQPLRGRRIVVDPGHPPGGAIGPTGLTEAEANLAIALPLAEMLRARGAEVIVTRTENVPVSLDARTSLAVRADADLLVSVHNNAFGEGQNPFTGYGTSVLYFHPHSLELARTLNDAIVALTRIPDKGAIFQDIALARPTWMPAVLTESLYMMFPEQENALRDPDFVARLAAAHVRGIENFLRTRSTAP